VSIPVFSPRELAIIAFAVVVIVLVARAWFRLWWDKRRTARATRQRFKRGEEGELLAEQLLREAGFSIVERQIQGVWELIVDGEPQTVRVYADFLVEDDTGRYIAEAKTGEVAANIGRAATRRQLLEYRHVFDVDGICLVDVENDSIHWVDFSSGVTPTGGSGSAAGRKFTETELRQ
jgi:hypothetical protein